jgi:hypothetical protein
MLKTVTRYCFYRSVSFYWVQGFSKVNLNSQKWTSADLSAAIKTAVLQNSSQTKVSGGKLLFNGFWRQGEHQNVCLWPDRGTWHDAKTGDGGGCKEFAKVAFNLSLPEFMKRFGTLSSQINDNLPLKEIFDAQKQLNKSINQIWLELQKLDQNQPDLAEKWLISERGFYLPRFNIGSGFANLSIEGVELFEHFHQKFIRHRLSLGPQVIVPLRGIHSDQVQNLFFRAISECSKEEKSRLLAGAGGWHETDGTPRAFGFPHLIHDFPNLVLCEGMADYFAAECLLEDNEKFLPIGTASASAIPKWAEWLIKTNYKGQIIIVNQWDENNFGQISPDGIGPSKSVQALAALKKENLAARLFDWSFYLENTTTHPAGIKDLADSLRSEALHKECGAGHLNYCFLICLETQGRT